MVVTLEYTLRSPAGEVLDTSQGREPMRYLHGLGAVLPGLEAALEGRRAGEKVKLALNPEQAFGVRKPSLVIPVSRKDFPVADLAVGMAFQVDTDAGPRIVRVASIDGESVTVDANHRWAGLNVEVEASILEIRPAKPEEIEHGHVCYGDHSCHQRRTPINT